MNLLSVSQRKNNTLFIVKACWEHCRWFISYCGTYRYLLSCHGKHISFILQYSSVDKTGTVRVFFLTWLKKVIACFWNTPVPCAGIPDANQNPVRVRLTPERPFQPPQIPNKLFLHSFTHFENKNYYISCS